MGIKFRCHACDKKLHVKAFLAGKRGVCPKCGAKVRIPLTSQDPSDEAAGQDERRAGASAAASAAGGRPPVPAAVTPDAARTAADPADTEHRAGSQVLTSSGHDPIAEAPGAVWYVRPPTGGQFGPADGKIMRRWLTEGRVSADALVWREGWPDWRSAGPVFPALEGPDLALPASPPALAVADESFAVAGARHAVERYRAPSHPDSRTRLVTLVASLVVLGVVLLVTLVLVLRAGS